MSLSPPGWSDKRRDYTDQLAPFSFRFIAKRLPFSERHENCHPKDSFGRRHAAPVTEAPVTAEGTGLPNPDERACSLLLTAERPWRVTDGHAWKGRED
jgi:hypothetical protein